MTADPTRRLSSMDVLDDGERARLDEFGNRAVLTRPATAGVDSGVVRRAGGAHPGGGGGHLRGAARGRTASWMRPRIGWRTCWPARGRARGVCGAAVFPVGRGDHRDSGGAKDRGGVSADRPGATRRPGSSSWWPTPRRSPRSPPPGWPTGWTGAICRSSMSNDPAVDTHPSTALAGAGAPRTSPTSSTPRAPPVCPRGWRSPTTT